MKRTMSVVLLLMVLAATGNSQNVNWKTSSEDQRNLIHINAGYDYGVTTQVGYYRSLTIIRPVLLGLDYSVPMGSHLLDDFKVRLGAQVELVEIGGFLTTVKIMSSFRRYENPLVRIVSFGSDFAVVAGYYDPAWYAAGEFGFDKSIVSNLKHSDTMRKYVYSGIRDGWYIPTGGNYYYGIQAGKSISRSLDLSLRLGATTAQDHDKNAVLPFYAQLGLGVKF
jgi:hypothetical protein